MRMARIILGGYLFRYPLGGNISCTLQYLLGLLAEGHEVFYVEKSAYAGSCYNPVRKENSDDCTYGLKVVSSVLSGAGLRRWCFVDAGGSYFGMSRDAVEEAFRTADLFIDMGSHEAWLEEASWARSRILIDGDPGFSQIFMEMRSAAGKPPPAYDFYFTVGRNLCGALGKEPRAGVFWNHIYHPISTSAVTFSPGSDSNPFSTVMNWQSYAEAIYQGKTYGHKNIEFIRFLNLPLMTDAKLEIAVSGKDVPYDDLVTAGWKVRDAQAVTLSLSSYYSYLKGSAGEVSVCKNGFVDLHTGWFGDRSSCYLAIGRPVILQETGFSEHLPTGKGLFSFVSAEEVVESLKQIKMDYQLHSLAAREIAQEFLDAQKVMKGVLNTIGL
jgi:hypothetical protein